MKTPWSLIGWLLAGLLALFFSLGLYYLGLILGWRPWLAPAMLWLPLALAALFRLAAWLLARPLAPSVQPLDPSNPLSGQWEAMKSGLSEGEWELFLLLGDDDETKRRFLSRALGQAGYQSAPAGPDGLSLWAAEGRAWLNVPAALCYEEPQSLPGGDWGHLMKLLPGFPGPLRGLVFLADPRKIYESPELCGRILAQRLSLLPDPPPPWWLLLYPLEKLASGRNLAEALRREAGEGEMWRRPFGLFLKNSKSSLPQKLAEAQSFLADSLGRQLQQIDCWGGQPSLAREIFIFQHEFRGLPLDYFSAEADAAAAPCDGLFLAMEAPESPGQFNELLLQNLIPARRPGVEALRRGRSRRFIRGLAAVLLLGGLTFLAFGYWQGRAALNLAAKAFPLLSHIDSQPADPPPVASLALAGEAVTRLEEMAAGPAAIYGAPSKAAQTAKLRLARQLRRRLPPRAPAEAFMKALAHWAGRGISPFVFQYTGGESMVPGFAGQEARERIAALAEQWNNILADSEAETERFVAHYEDMMFRLWRGPAEEFSKVSLKADDFRLIAQSGFARPMAGLTFLEAAGSQLSFETGRKIPAWILSARELSFLGPFTDFDLADEGAELAAVFNQIRGHSFADCGGGLETHIEAAGLWEKYKTATQAVSELAQSPQGLIQLAEEMFSGRPAPPDRPTLPALRQLGEETLKALGEIEQISPPDEREMFTNIFLSPPDLIGEASIFAAAAALEEEWNRKIVLPSQDLPEEEKAALLLGEEGALAAFRNGPAAPYLEAGPKGYRPREAFGRKFPWRREFLDFVNKAQTSWKKDPAAEQVTISAHLRPVRAEGEWLNSHPLGLSLTMICDGEELWAETYNQPAAFTADWSPQTCGPLSVTVIFRDFILSKDYEGAEGLATFLSAAASGEIRLTPDDFPGQAHLMNAAGAEAVTLSLDIDQAQEIVNTLTSPPPALNPPARVTFHASPKSPG